MSLSTITLSNYDGIYIPDNIRFGKLTDIPKLAESLLIEGQEQPIGLSTSGAPEGFTYRLRFGNRRLAAARFIQDNPEKFIGKVKRRGVPVPDSEILHFSLRAEVQDDSGDTLPEIGAAAEAVAAQIAENFQRVDSTPMDAAKAIQTAKEAGYTQSQIAKMMNKAASWVSITAQFLDLGTEIQDALHSGILTWTDGKNIVALDPAKREARGAKLIEAAKAVRDAADSGDKEEKKKARKKARKVKEDEGLAGGGLNIQDILEEFKIVGITANPAIRLILRAVGKYLSGDGGIDALVEKLSGVVDAEAKAA